MTRLHAAAALVLWGLLVLIVGALVGGGATAGGTPNRAGLVVVGEGGATHRQCVEFAEDEISGVELLRRSGLSVVFSSSGAFGKGVCSLDGTGCNDPGDCFCQCRGADCAYWSYFRLADDGWRFQAVGASQRRLGHGDVDGWVWGDGSEPPGDVTFAEVCPLAQAPTATARATATPRPQSQPPSAVPTRPASAPTSAGASAPAADTPSPEATAPAPTRTRAAASDEPRAIARNDDATRGRAGDEATDDDSSSSAPVGLIAFGAVAGALAAGIGGLAVRRRLRG